MVSFVSLVSLVQISQQNCSQTANFAAFVSISLVSLVSVAQKHQNQQVSCSSHLSHFCHTCLTCSKNSQIPVLCLSHLSQSLSQFVSMEAVIPENSQICQFFVCLFQLYQSQQRVSCKKQPNWPVLRLSHLSHLSQGGLSGSGKKTSVCLGGPVPVWAD